MSFIVRTAYFPDGSVYRNLPYSDAFRIGYVYEDTVGGKWFMLEIVEMSVPEIINGICIIDEATLEYVSRMKYENV